MLARGAAPCLFRARPQQLREAHCSCAAGKTPQKSPGLRTTTLHTVAWAAGGIRGCCWARKVQLTAGCLCLCSDFGDDQGDSPGGESPVASGGSRAGSESSLGVSLSRENSDGPGLGGQYREIIAVSRHALAGRSSSRSPTKESISSWHLFVQKHLSEVLAKDPSMTPQKTMQWVATMCRDMPKQYLEGASVYYEEKPSAQMRVRSL